MWRPLKHLAGRGCPLNNHAYHPQCFCLLLGASRRRATLVVWQLAYSSVRSGS